LLLLLLLVLVLVLAVHIRWTSRSRIAASLVIPGHLLLLLCITVCPGLQLIPRLQRQLLLLQLLLTVLLLSLLLPFLGLMEHYFTSICTGIAFPFQCILWLFLQHCSCVCLCGSPGLQGALPFCVPRGRGQLSLQQATGAVWRWATQEVVQLTNIQTIRG
jgi:hypothetical protein